MTPIDHQASVISGKPAVNLWLGTGAGVFGWVNVWFPKGVYWVVGLFWLAVAALFAAASARWWRATAGPERLARLAPAAFLASVTVLTLAALHYTDYTFLSPARALFMQGRYLLPLGGVVAAAVGWALMALPARRRGSPPGSGSARCSSSRSPRSGSCWDAGMRRGAVIALVVVVLAGARGAAAIGAAGTARPDTQTLGTLPVQQLTTIGLADRVCQRPITPADPIRAVSLVVAPGATTRGPVRVTVREPDIGNKGTGTVLAEATRPREVLTGQPQTWVLDRPVAPEQFLSVCVEQNGREPIELWGDTAPAHAGHEPGVQERQLLGGDLYMTFPDPDGGSLLDRLPAAFRHAAPYKLSGIGGWTFWALAC